MQTVTSKDGTKIAYDKKGKGPAVIFVLGALNSRKSGAKLAKLLAARFTVISYDRRGRGTSTDTAPYSPQSEVEDIAAVACAVQNMYLSLTAYGLGGYWTTGGVTYNEKAKPFFGLGEDDRLMGFFYIGHIAVPSPAAKRSPLEQKVKWIYE